MEEEVMIVAFHKHTLLPLEDCFYVLQPNILHLTRLPIASLLPTP